MHPTARTARRAELKALAHVQVQRLTTPQAKARVRRRLARHHCPGEVRAVGEQLWYALGDSLDVLVFCAASRRWRARARWIGWTDGQRRRRRPLGVNPCRLLLARERGSADGQARYGHPVVLVETLVDPEPFCGTGRTSAGCVGPR